MNFTEFEIKLMDIHDKYFDLHGVELTEFQIRLVEIHDKYDNLYDFEQSSMRDEDEDKSIYYKDPDYLKKCHEDSKSKLAGMGNDSICLYLDYLEKITDSLKVDCETQEHFICILITLEDLICECPFYTDEFKHNEHIKLIEYRINFMNNKNTIK